MIHIRPAAIQEFQRLIHQSAKTATGADRGQPPRIFLDLKPSSCAQWSYCLGPCLDPDRPVTLVDCGVLTLAVASDCLDRVADLTIDYAEDLMGGGFRFINPLAQHTCGCGNAFALDSSVSAAAHCATASPD